jgi:hypothetical protein
MTDRRRVICEYIGGNRVVTPWYHTTDPRLAQFLRNTDQMVWMRVEKEHA